MKKTSAKKRNHRKETGFKLTVGEDTHIDDSVSFHGIVKVGDRCFIDARVTIGHPAFYDLAEISAEKQGETVIGNNVIIHPNVIISSNVSIKSQVRIGPFVTIWKNTTIGENTQLMYNAQIHENVDVGKNCRVGGFLCDYAKIGNYVAVFGNLVHRFDEGWVEDENLARKSPILEDNVVVGIGSTVIGPVVLRSGTYVAAGAIVSRSTPGNCKITLVNKVGPRGSLRCLEG